MKTNLLFPTPLWINEECGVERQPIIDFVHYVQQEDPDGRRATNAGGWQSWDFIDSVMINNPLKPLRDKILECAYYAADEWGFQKYSLKILNLWLNVNKKGHFNHLHTHAGSLYCSCMLQAHAFKAIFPSRDFHLSPFTFHL